MITEDPSNATVITVSPPKEITENLLIHAQFVNTYCLKTEAGLVLIDPGLTYGTHSVKTAVNNWTTLRLHTAIYTHGHADHAFGLGAFLDAGEHPKIVSQVRLFMKFVRLSVSTRFSYHIFEYVGGNDVGRKTW